MKLFLLIAALASLLTHPLAGQQPKSKEEVDALIALQSAQTPDERIAAAQKLLTDFKDTEFKETANYVLMLAYQQKNDFENMLLYGERTLSINPDNAGTLISLANAIPMRTREFDLDKDEKLAKAEDFAKRSLTVIPNLAKPNPEMPDDQWLMAKKDFMASAYESLGLVAMKRKSYPAAEENLRKSLEISAEQTAAAFFYLGQVLKEQGKKDDAIAALDQAIARGDFQLGDGRPAAATLKAEIQNAK
jgi:tetratricopeptide (TPR) repeat protein